MAEKKLFDEYFNSVYARSNALNGDSYERISKDYHLEFGQFLPEDKDTPILEIGCGGGHFLYYLKMRGFTNYLGIDMSESQIGFCRENVTTNVECADADGFLRGKENIFGIIAANDVLEHIPKEQVITFLETARRALKQEGFLLLKLPNMSNPFALDSRYRDFTHECGFTEKSIYQVLYVAGFRDIRVYPSRIHGTSFKAFLNRIAVSLLHAVIKKLYWHQGFTAPELLSPRLIVAARK